MARLPPAVIKSTVAATVGGTLAAVPYLSWRDPVRAGSSGRFMTSRVEPITAILDWAWYLDRTVHFMARPAAAEIAITTLAAVSSGLGRRRRPAPASCAIGRRRCFISSPDSRTDPIPPAA